MSVLDPAKNFAYSTVATAPSPATSGTSIVLASGDGSKFPDPATEGAYNVVIFPTGVQPTVANSEIVRVTARSTDTLTVTRTQESTSARTIIVGDQVALNITSKFRNDIENRILYKTFINVKDFGATGDGSTDDTAAIQDAIDSASAGGCIFFPYGNYKITSALTTGSYYLEFLGEDKAQTIITTTSATANMFTVASDYGGIFKNLYLTSSVTRTAGYAIQYTGGGSTSRNGFCRIDNCQITEMYNGLGMLENYQFGISNCDIIDCVTNGTGIKVGNSTDADQGDSYIINCYISGPNDNTGVGISQTSSGGLRIISTKVQHFSVGYAYDIAIGSTINLFIMGCSFENQGSAGLYFARTSGSYTMGNILIQGCEIGAFATADFKGIQFNSAGYSDISIINNIFYGPGTASMVTTGVQIDNASNVVIANNIFTGVGWDTGVSIGASATNVFIGVNKYINCTTEVTNSSTTSSRQSYKYTMRLDAPNQATTTDAATVHFGMPAVVGTAAQMAQSVPISGTIVAAYINWWAATAGTGESFTAYLRKNDTTDITIQAVANTNSVKSFSNTALSTAITAGDTICGKFIYPTWATNPANVRVSGIVVIEVNM